MKSKSLKILIGASGSIGVLNLHNYLIYFCCFAESINVIMSQAACRMVQPDSIRAITGNRVYTDDNEALVLVPHITLARWADLFIVLPASANTLGKAANGIADNLLSTTMLAATAPIFFIPNMNEEMWAKAVVQRNVKTLEADGHYIIHCDSPRKVFEASSGRTLASDLMPSPQEIMEIIERYLTGQHIET